MIVLFTVLLALANEPFRPVMMTLVGDLVSSDKRRMAYTFLRFSINVGMSIGPALGGYLATRSFTWLFLIDGITSFLAGVYLWRKLPHLSVQKEAQVSDDLTPKSGGFFAVIKDVPFVFFLISMVGIGMVYFQHESTQPLFMVNNLGLIESDVGLIFLTNTILVILFEIPLNLRIKAWSHLSSLTLGCVLMTLGFGLLVFAHSLWFVLVTVGVWTFGEMITFAAAGSWVSERGAKQTQGLYMGYFSSAFGIAAMVGPWAGAQLLEKAGPVSLWGACFFIGILSTALLLGIRKPSQSVV
jgi:MFS family permease